MRLADLYGKRVRGPGKQIYGVVHEVRAKGGVVEALDCGAASFLEQLTGKRKGRRILWKDVTKITKDEIQVDT